MHKSEHLGVALPSIAELQASAIAFRVPLRTKFRGVTYREGLLLCGPRGVGEFAPFDDYPAAGAARWLLAAVDAAWGEPLPTLRTEVLVNAIVPDGDIATTVQIAREAAAGGCRTMKVKVASPAGLGPHLQDVTERDIPRLREVRAILDAEFGVGQGAIRIDANAAWTAADAIRILPLLAEAAGGLEYVEQPCQDLEDCAQVRAETGVRIAIDEGLRLAQNFDTAVVDAVREAADVVIVKPIPMGGAAEVIRIVQEIQRPVVVSGSMDTSIGLSYVLNTACAIPGLALACGLGTGSLLAGDLTAKTLLPTRGTLSKADVAVDPEALRAHTIAEEDPRHSWWLQRLHDAATHIAALGSVGA